MKKCDKEDYMIVSELSHHYMDDDDDWKMTPKQAKLVIAGIFLLLVAILVFVVYRQAQDYEQMLVEEERLEAQLEEEEARHEQLMLQADELCMTRVQRYTSNGVVELDSLLYSYQFEPTETGWVDQYGRLSFDFSDDSRLIMRYQKTDSSEVYIHKNTTETSMDDYQCKIGAQIVIFSQNDMRALGRILIGDTDDFYLE